MYIYMYITVLFRSITINDEFDVHCMCNNKSCWSDNWNVPTFKLGSKRLKIVFFVIKQSFNKIYKK